MTNGKGSSLFMSPAQAAREIERRGRALLRAMKRAEGASVAEAVNFAITLSSGPYRPAALRRLGSPYARIRPRPPLPPFFINVNKGALRRGWRRKTGAWDGGQLVSTLFN